MLELLFNVSGVHIKDFLALPGKFDFVFLGVSLLFVSAVLLFLLILYKKLRRKFHVRVNCWFCNSYATVPYDLSNSWDCPHCLQYNGFNKQGDYNKVIHEHYDSKLNDNIFCSLKKSLNTKCDISNFKNNGFCKLCNINQQLKIQQLALFVPINENNYFEEIEQYRQKLEKAYQLCSKCELTLKDTLKKQEYDLLIGRLNDHKQESQFKKKEKVSVLTIKKFRFKLNTVLIGLKWIITISAILLLVALFHKFETENHIKYLKLPSLFILEPLDPFFRVFVDYLNKICKIGKELSFIGFICSLLSIFECNDKLNQMNLLIWGLLHVLLWSNLTGIQTGTAGILVFFNLQNIKNKKIYSKKKSLPKKFSFKPQGQISPKTFHFSDNEDLGSNLSTSSIKQNKMFESMSSLYNSKDIKKQQEKNLKHDFSICEEEKKKTNECEVELITNVEKDYNQSKPGDLENLDSTIFNSTPNKTFLSVPEVIKKEDTNGSLDDVYNYLNDLHLGGRQKKLNKPTNFLFASHDSFEKNKSLPLIKPSKLMKNLSNSWIWPESNESASRSSTPSSGYSSQKTEKVQGNRYNFMKSVSPVPLNIFSRQTLQNRFDYWDGNNGFYGNLNGFSPGFAPFHQFPGSIGHAAIYTCSRPANLSFPCHWQGFSPQRLSPTSPRISDISDSENLFQNASKSFENSKKWLKVKTFAYYFSISLNVITFLGILYFISSGFISVGWNLPKLNFFV